MLVTIGLPGVGKTHTSTQLAESIKGFYIQGDEFRAELFEEVERTPAQDNIVNRLVSLMTDKFMEKRFNIVIDANFSRRIDRSRLKKLCRSLGYGLLYIWVQTDVDTSFYRAAKRDRRRVDDKFAVSVNEDDFQRLMHHFQPPQFEDYVVVSGKHVYKTQLASIIKKLNDLELLKPPAPQNTFKPRTTQVKSMRHVAKRRRLTI
jgi:predicted kinase